MLCVTAKDKLRALLASGGVPAFSAEHAHEQALADGTPVTDVVGAPTPDIYDWRLSPYTIDLAVALAARLDATLVYASLTDFVQHAAAPGRADGRRVLPRGRRRDRPRARRRLRRRPRRRPRHARQDRRPTAARTSASSTRRSPPPASAARHTLCPITDPYVVHHAALGSLAWVHLDDLDELDRARGALAALPGVEAVLDRFAAADAFELPGRPDRRPGRARRRRAPCSASRARRTTSARCTARCARTAGCTSARCR